MTDAYATDDALKLAKLVAYVVKRQRRKITEE